MPPLRTMPQIQIAVDELAPFGRQWQANGEKLSRTPPYSSNDLGKFFDERVGTALALMLGSIPIIAPNPNDLIPQAPDCVEVGPCRIVGGVRPQNFDVGYRPDGVRFAFDSKTLNDKASVKKNYQNMINDISTEATTVHTRFPFAIVAFFVIIPVPCLIAPQKEALTETLLRLTSRRSPLDSPHKAEAISLVLWDPHSGQIDHTHPSHDSILRIESFSVQVEQAYVDRYRGLPPQA